MSKFLGRWDREGCPAHDAEILRDRIVTETIQLILDTEGPLLPLPRPFTLDYYRTILRTVIHMCELYPLDVYGQGIDCAQSPQDAAQHQNLRSWVYYQACKDAMALLADWCAKAGLDMPVADPESAVILVRALRAERQQMLASGDHAVLLSAVFQECVAQLEGLASLDPQAQLITQVIEDANILDRSDSPWRAFIEWLVTRLPEGELTV